MAHQQTKIGCLAVAALLTAGGGTSSCQPEPAATPRKPVSSFNTTTNAITINAPLSAKSHSDRHFVFVFKVDATTTTVWVTSRTYGRYAVGNWVHLQCAAGVECVEV